MSLAELHDQPSVRAAREALAPTDAWIVGGTVRDALLKRPLTDLDIAVAGDPEQAARNVARALGGTAFQLSEEFGAWRVVRRKERFTCDLAPLQGPAIEADLG
ncbi:MAG: poly(A) polymerase, partial [Thermoleophilaceae bacterium]|nr:poly(A) polymerase [Thermoleophilaceae bacterium]